MTIPDMIEKISWAWNNCGFKTKTTIVILTAFILFIL